MTDSSKLGQEELIRELRRLATELGEPPSIPEMNEYGQYSAPPYYRVFGSWPAALEAAGFEARTSTEERSRDELIAEIRELATGDEPPSQSQMSEEGAYAVGTYSSHFGSWTAALREAGFDPPTSGTRLSEAELCDALTTLADDLSSTPTSADMNEHGPYSAGTYINRFGSWKEALAAAGVDSNDISRSATKEELIEGLKQVAADSEGPPTTREMNEHGPYHAHTYRLRFGSWDAALEAAGIESSEKSSEPANKIDCDDLIEELRNLAANQEANQPPTTTMMQEDGEYSVGTYTNRFGSWSNALSAADLDDRK